jgi:cob(I)alamin adenosyltransferase
MGTSGRREIQASDACYRPNTPSVYPAEPAKLACQLHLAELGPAQQSAGVKIYTKTGDAGETGLFGGVRVKKDDPRIEFTGTLDELNATLGVARSLSSHTHTSDILARIQGELFTLGAECSCTKEALPKLRVELILDADVERLEAEIDSMTAELPELKTFILPGGCPSAAELHRARTVARRAERHIFLLEEARPVVQRYVNRLSDHLFTLARWENALAETSETQWLGTRLKKGS